MNVLYRIIEIVTMPDKSVKIFMLSRFFAEHAAEAFATKCRRCTEVQKKNVEKIVVWYTENRPQEWQAMVQKLMDDAKKLNIPFTR